MMKEEWESNNPVFSFVLVLFLGALNFSVNRTSSAVIFFGFLLINNQYSAKLSMLLAPDLSTRQHIKNLVK